MEWMYWSCRPESRSPGQLLDSTRLRPPPPPPEAEEAEATEGTPPGDGSKGREAADSIRSNGGGGGSVYGGSVLGSAQYELLARAKDLECVHCR